MSLFKRTKKVSGSFQAWVWRQDGNALGNILRAVLRFMFILRREMEQDRIALRAAALTYTVMLSLVPTLALGTAVLKGLGAGDQMRQAAYRFIDQFESPADTPQALPPAEQAVTPAPDTDLPLPDSGVRSAPAETPQIGPPGSLSVEKSLTAHLRRAVDQLFAYVERTNFATLGAFGVVGLILAVLSLLGSIEQAMNIIWHAESSRPLGRRLMDYMALLILLPVSINLGLATEAALQSPGLLNRMQDLLPVAWLIHLKILPVMAMVAAFTLLYWIIPNAKVRPLPAVLGGIVGGIGWLAAQMLYLKLQIGVARYNAIYGSFATLPLLLLWIHLGWTIFLAGAEIAFAAQVWRNYNWQKPELTPAARLALAFHITGQAMLDFHARKVTDAVDLADQLKQPPVLINEVIRDLVKADVLRPVCDPAAGYVPAAPEEEVRPDEIIDLIFGSEVPQIKGGWLAADAVAAARSAVAERKLTDDSPAIFTGKG